MKAPRIHLFKSFGLWMRRIAIGGFDSCVLSIKYESPTSIYMDEALGLKNFLKSVN